MQRFVYTSCFALLSIAAAHAQNASLSGLVTDTSSAVVAQN